MNGTEDDPAQSGAQLTFSPGRIEPNDPVWKDSRKPLAGEFRFRGRKVFVVANHFASKGGDAALFGRFQEPYRPSELQRRGARRRRRERWVERLQDAERGGRVIVLGDLNDFEFSETSACSSAASRAAGRSSPTYGSCCRAASTTRTSSRGTGRCWTTSSDPRACSRRSRSFAPVHMNSEFDDEEQQSDHDPPLVRLRVTG